jgi:hypothetical protein
MKRLSATIMFLCLSGGLALAQVPNNIPPAGPGTPGPTFPNATPGPTVGQTPAPNASNPQDLTGRSNPQDMTQPRAINPQDLTTRPH